MAIDFPTPEQFAASQGARPLLTIIAGIAVAIFLGAVLKRVPFFKRRIRFWQAAVVVLTATVPWQLHQYVNRSYQQIAEQWRSTDLASPTTITIVEQRRADGAWIDQKQLIHQVDPQRLIEALQGCVRSRQPAKWFRGRRLHVQLADPANASRELAFTVLAAAPEQRHANLPDSCVTFSALNLGDTIPPSWMLEFECPALSRLIESL